MFLAKRVRCFNCNVKLKNADNAFTIKLKTADGPHEVMMCFDCSQEFDKIALQLEEIIDERFNSL